MEKIHILIFLSTELKLNLTDLFYTKCISINLALTSTEIHYEGRPTATEIHYEGRPTATEIHYEGRPTAT